MSYRMGATCSTAASTDRITDNYGSIRQVQDALRLKGLEGSDLIIGIDFTKSNLDSGKRTFNGKSLHHISSGKHNPYQECIAIIGETLKEFDDDNIIPVFGFGDGTTTDNSVFAFSADMCHGHDEVLERYALIAPHVVLSGPTTFAPLIYAAIDTVINADFKYHILIIIADGQVSQGASYDETIAAIVEASYYPLSIIMFGVGDGPWDQMKTFDDNIKRRKFDNFQFVPFAATMNRYEDTDHVNANFAMHALMEIPEQYGYISRHRLTSATYKRPELSHTANIKECPVVFDNTPPRYRR